MKSPRFDVVCLTNLAGHDVKLWAQDDGWRVWHTLPGSDAVASVADGAVSGLPAPDWLAVRAYLVTPEVAAAAPERRDLWVESDSVRDLDTGDWTRHRGIQRAHLVNSKKE